jgi:AraC-like DNA-binding protein
LPADVAETVRLKAQALIGDEAFQPRELWRTIIHVLSILGLRPREIDPRIRTVLKSLKENVLSPPSAAELAEKVNLSEGRLIHLFTEQMGLPMRRYTLWLRLRDAFLTLAEGASLTEAAHRAGFADSAHMTRTFRGMFGIPPSFFKEGRGRVRTEFSITPDAQSRAHPGDQERWARVLEPRGRK